VRRSICEGIRYSGRLRSWYPIRKRGGQRWIKVREQKCYRDIACGVPRKVQRKCEALARFKGWAPYPFSEFYGIAPARRA
jgi:hypothetical protein